MAGAGAGAGAARRVVKYVGRTTDFCGKTLWEVVGALRGGGVGRLLTRSIYRRYPEPTYLRVARVETCPDEERRRVRVWVEKTFRGHTQPKLTEIFRTSYKPDYILIPKNEEAKYLNNKLVHHRPDVILPTSIEMPPLMKEFIKADHIKKGLPLPTDFKMPLSYHKSPNRIKRIAQGGEQSTVEFPIGLGKPASPSLYEGVPLQ